MPRITRTFEVSGSIYHNQKKDFKAFLKTVPVKWTGTWSNVEWSNNLVCVHADFERDQNTDTTISAIFTITGVEPRVNKISSYLLEYLLATETTTEPEKSITPFDKELALYDMVYVEPSNKLPSMYRYPQKTIDYLKKKWSEDREDYIQSLCDKYNID